MPNNHYSDFYVEELTWDKVRNGVTKANAQLAAIIDKFDPGKDHTFLKAKYRFGDRILDQGVTCLPLKDGGTMPLNHEKMPSTLKKKLGYGLVPMAFILTKSVEVFFETEDRVMPSKLFGEGTTFGLWEAFDPLPPEFLRKAWCLCAGARSIWMLPSISDSMSHSRLRRDCSITSYPPKTLLDHSAVFTELNKYADSKGEGWYCEVLFFCDKWLDYKEDNLACVRLQRYWLYEAWTQSYNCRTQMSYDVSWEAFSKAVTKKNWKPKAYIISILKHLMAIGTGTFPGFIPACDSEIAAPIKFLQDCYINHYLLKEYAPIIMSPHHLSDPNIPVYWSLSLPTQLEYAPRARNTPSVLSDMRELKMLMEVLFSSMKDNPIQCEFFHCEPDESSKIKPFSDMPMGDKRLMKYPSEYGERIFPFNSAFGRGCIRISRTK